MLSFAENLCILYPYKNMQKLLTHCSTQSGGNGGKPEQINSETQLGFEPMTLEFT